MRLKRSFPFSIPSRPESMLLRMTIVLLSIAAFNPFSVSFAEETADPNKLLEKMDQIVRGTTHDMTISMQVHTAKWERQYKIRVWMKGVDWAFARVLEPAKVEGQGFLRQKGRLWNYMPTAEKTILIPPSMMLDQFMGSDFTNDDFVKLTYLPRDYDGKIVGEENLDGNSVHHLELIPKPDAPVIYGKLEIWLRKSDAAPVKLQFYNEDQKLIRTLHYSEFKKFGDHETPTLWKMENQEDPDRTTTIQIMDAAFDGEIQDSLFTRENLEKYS